MDRIGGIGKWLWAVAWVAMIVVSWLAVVGVVGMFTGCVKTVDPQTGQTLVQIDPKTGEVIDNVVAPVATGAAGVLTYMGPVGALVGGLLVGAVGAWRKMKPSLVAAKTEAEQYYAVAAGTVEAIEELKKEHPDQWKAMGDYLEKTLAKQNVDVKTIENVIRALRGLSAKA